MVPRVWLQPPIAWFLFGWIFEVSQAFRQPPVGLFISSSAPAGLFISSSGPAGLFISSYEWLTTATYQLTSVAFLFGFPSLSLSATCYIISLQFSKVFMNGSPKAMYQLSAIQWRSVSITAMVSALLIAAGLLLLTKYMFGICDSVVLRPQVHFMKGTVRE